MNNPCVDVTVSRVCKLSGTVLGIEIPYWSSVSCTVLGLSSEIHQTIPHLNFTYTLEDSPWVLLRAKPYFLYPSRKSVIQYKKYIIYSNLPKKKSPTVLISYKIFYRYLTSTIHNNNLKKYIVNYKLQSIEII